MMQSIRVTTPAVAEPFTLAEAKAHLHVVSTYEDALITDLITAARQMAEAVARISIPVQLYKLTLQRWPKGKDLWWDGVREGAINMLNQYQNWVEIPVPPLVSVQSVITYLDETDAPATMTAGDYYVDISDPKAPGRVVLRTGRVWPVALRAANPIEINFTAGYGTTFPLPYDLKRAMLMVLTSLYRNRGDSGTPEEVATQCGAYPILATYRVQRLH